MKQFIIELIVVIAILSLCALFVKGVIIDKDQCTDLKPTKLSVQLINGNTIEKIVMTPTNYKFEIVTNHGSYVLVLKTDCAIGDTYRIHGAIVVNGAVHFEEIKPTFNQ